MSSMEYFIIYYYNLLSLVLFFFFIQLESNGTVIDDSEYPKVFFLMHKWIMESEHLSNMLYDLYKNSTNDLKKATNSNEKRLSKEHQLRICHAFKYVIRILKAKKKRLHCF